MTDDKSSNMPEQPKIGSIFSRLRRSPIALAILIFGVGWLLLQFYELQFHKPSIVEDTHYWEAGNISIDWRFRTTDVKIKKSDSESTLCLAYGKIKNRDVSRRLKVHRVNFILEDRAGFQLFEYDKNWFSLTIDPEGIEEFSMQFYVPTALLGEANELSAGLGYEFEGKKE